MERVTSLFLNNEICSCQFTRIHNRDGLLWFTTLGTDTFNLFYHVHALNDFTKDHVLHIYGYKHLSMSDRSVHNRVTWRTLPSNHDVWTVQMKNCEPLVFGPALAMDKVPSPSCFLERKKAHTGQYRGCVHICPYNTRTKQSFHRWICRHKLTVSVSGGDTTNQTKSQFSERMDI